MNKINYLSHNWLIVKTNNAALAQYLHRIKGRVIDLGCGAAPYKKDILSVTPQYIGVDWPSTFHRQDSIDVFSNISQPLPFQAGCADTVTAFQVLEHLPEPDLFLSECCRLLKSGGLLFITVPFMWHVHEAPHDYFRYTGYGLEYLLKKNNFSSIEIHETTGFWQTWVLKFNYHTIRYAKSVLRIFWIPIWWLGQVISPVLDRFDKHAEETASYVVIAMKRIH